MIKKEKLLHCSAFLFTLALPLSTKIGNLALGLFLILALLNTRSDSKYELRIIKYSTAIFFIAFLSGFMVLGDVSVGINQLGKKIFYLITPIIVCFLSKENIDRTIKYSLKGLFYGCLACSIILVFHNFYEYYLTRPFFYLDKDIFNFYYTSYNFTRILKIHPTYLGSYFVLALVYLLNILFIQKKHYKTAILILTLIFYTFTIVFLNARIIYGLTFLVFVFFFIRSARILYRKSKFLSFSLPLLFIAMVVIGYNALNKTYVASRLTEELKWELSNEVGTEYSYNRKGDSRFARWKSGISVIKKKPILGHGLHSEKGVLVKEYKINGMQASIVNRYDSHNQFISFFIQFGLIGLVIIVYFISNFYFAFKTKNVIYFALIFIIFSICLVENYLNMNAGVLFVAFFSSVFLAQEKNSKSLYYGE